MRTKRYFYSICGSLVGQLITIICGIILPRVLIKQFGSELYGATTSITQFLGYITLLEGGIGGVARAALYKPLADNNDAEISKVVSYIQRFFRMIALIFGIYSLIIAVSFHFIARNNNLDWFFSFLLVIVIALSSLAQYYFGIAYTVLLQADQKIYFTKTLDAVALLANTIISCLLVYFGANMIVIKLVWCGVHVIRIGVLNVYIKKHYRIQKLEVKEDYLPEKWDGLGQHLAYFLHSHTDVIVLTLFVNLSEVSVYTIYNYIVSSLNTLVLALGANMEAVFGDMLARNERDHLNHFFNYIEFILNFAIIVGFSVAAGLILPFVSIYTSGITDADYYRPMLAYLMLLAQMVYCIRMPYHALTIAAGHFKSTKTAAFLESALNIVLSCFFGILCGTEGVILATFISICYRAIYYAIYIEHNILYRKRRLFLKRLTITFFNVIINIIIFQLLSRLIGLIHTFGKWVIVACMYTLMALLMTALISNVFYKEEFNKVFLKIKNEFISKR